MFTTTFKHSRKNVAKISLAKRIQMYFKKPLIRLPVEETLDNSPVLNDAVGYVKEGLLFKSPDEIIKNVAMLNRMNRADVALVFLLDRMEQLIDEAETDTQLTLRLNQALDLHSACMKEIRTRLADYEALVRVGKSAVAGNRPADIARMWYRPTEWLIQHDTPSARYLLTRIDGHCTMPIEEILAPYWVDAYTGESDEDDFMSETVDGVRKMITFKKSNMLNNTPLAPAGTHTEATCYISTKLAIGKVSVLKHTDWHFVKGYLNSFLRFTVKRDVIEIAKKSQDARVASEDFDAERVEWDEMQDWRDSKDPVFMEMQNDGMPDEHLATLRQEFYPLLQEFRAEIEDALSYQDSMLTIDTEQYLSKNIVWMKNYPIEVGCKIAANVIGFPKTEYPEYVEAAKNAFFAISEENRGWFKERRAMKWVLAREAMRKCDTAEKVIEFLQANADNGENPANLAAIWLGVQHGLGFTEGDAEQVTLHGGLFGTLEDFNEDWLEDIILSLDGRSTSVWNEISAEELEAFTAKTIQDYSELVPIQHKDVTKTQAYIKGYLSAMCNGAKDTRSAIASGWDAWREWKSPEGNTAYLKASSSGANPKDAMKAFWVVANRETILNVHPTGLMLSSKRFVSYTIAAMKIKADEIAWQKGQKEWLKNVLSENKWGLNLIPLL
jgi:hypothetical protein